jgi:succinate dehydrogenase / fumarate reductase flavoprotein subunit
MYHQFKELGDVDITKEPREVGPTAHYTMGGIRVDPDSQETRVPGLFAAGECAGGMHGSNRLGGNSLSDLLVFGKIAGENAAKFAKNKQAKSLDSAQIEAYAKEALEPFNREKGKNPFAVHEDLMNVMQTYCGIMRNEADLTKCLSELERLKADADNTMIAGGNRHYNTGWHEVIDLRNMLIVSEAMARSALARKESRGGHARDDYSEMDEAFSKVNHVARLGGNGMEVEAVPLPDVPEEIKKVLEEKE